MAVEKSVGDLGVVHDNISHLNLRNEIIRKTKPKTKGMIRSILAKGRLPGS